MTCYISVDDDTWVCRSAVDSGANQSVHPERKDFTVYQKLEKPILIMVAKKGITMTAIGRGDLTLHTKDNTGKELRFVVKDMLHVPKCTKSVISVGKLGSQSNQVVFPCINEWFTPGVYLKKLSDNLEPSCIPLCSVNSLSYIPTRIDHVSKDGSLNAVCNKWIDAHWNLGFMPLATIRETIQCSIGLDHLLTSKFPTHFVSKHAIAGKLTNQDKPKATEKRTTRCFKLVHFDQAGLVKCN